MRVVTETWDHLGPLWTMCCITLHHVAWAATYAPLRHVKEKHKIFVCIPQHLQFRLLTGPRCSAGGTRMWYLSHFAPLRHCAIVHSTCPVPRLLEELQAVKIAEAEQGKRGSLQAWYRKRFRAVRQCLPPPECWIQYRCRLMQIFRSLDHDSLCELCVFQVDCC